MSDNRQIYNSRITKNYINYLANYYPQIDIGPLIEYAGMTRYEVEDPAHWFTQQHVDRFHEILEPTVPLSRHMFKAPTRFYKTGVVFMAYLNGHQDHFILVGGQESCRSLPHLAELFRLADKAGLLQDPEMAAGRMANVLKLHGLES